MSAMSRLLMLTAGLVATALSATVSTTPAQALTVSYELRITNTLIPNDPVFPNSSLSGSVQFSQFIPPPPLGEGFFVLVGGPIAIPGIGPGVTYPTDPIFPTDPLFPTDPVFPNDPLFISFGGTLSSSLGNFPAFFLPPNPIVPATPPSEAPTILLGSLANIGDTISLSGSVYAWDDPFQVGTWEITITAVPEPAAALLLMGALGGLALTRRRFSQVK